MRMKTDCNIIRDLLPLYADDVCSKESRALVDEHLQECPDCLEELVNLRKSEIEDRLGAEREDVIQKQKKQMGRRSAAIGSVLAWIFLIPVVICLFINRLQGGGMGWFLITLASGAVAASVTVVPLMVPENKLFWTLCAFCVSLVILLAVCALYTHGNWFFVAASASIFGLAVVFLPFAIKAKPLRP
jgi:anti-sigma factor RsiW